jgi:hypothetical protein
MKGEEMKQFVKWDVKEVKIEKDVGYSPNVTAILKASSPFGIFDDPRELHVDLQNKLNPDIPSKYPEMMITPDTLAYIHKDTETAVDMYYRAMKAGKRVGEKSTPKIEKVLFKDPATIVFWKDGTKTVVKAQRKEKYDPEKGLVMAMVKKILGNKGNYYNEIKKWLKED